mmetsp:Transcript_93740/g.268263  ORF Transcript_93740/g.268263 Transcript_93740/m.268263 type:complete len:231 (-) Transcript_93740:137-829(-)
MEAGAMNDWPFDSQYRCFRCFILILTPSTITRFFSRSTASTTPVCPCRCSGPPVTMTLSPVTMFHRLMGLSSFFLTFPLGRRAFGKLASCILRLIAREGVCRWRGRRAAKGYGGPGGPTAAGVLRVDGNFRRNRALREIEGRRAGLEGGGPRGTRSLYLELYTAPANTATSSAPNQYRHPVTNQAGCLLPACTGPTDPVRPPPTLPARASTTAGSPDAFLTRSAASQTES